MMVSRKKSLVSKILGRLKSINNLIYKKLNQWDGEEVFLYYEDLTPYDCADNDKIYQDAINYALENKNIKNIALTGPYGSGKSSILKTYFKNNKSKSRRMLNISLACFEEDEPDSRLIQKSILQQILYTEKPAKTPFSRFKRIEALNFKLVLIFLFSLASLSLFYLIFFKVDLLRNSYHNLNWIVDRLQLDFISVETLLIVLLLSIFMFAFIVANFIKRNFQISKIKYKNLDLDFDEEDKSSILNKYLEEVIYFFKRSSNSIVIFQDLDRFDNYDIFLKLRELNTLINNSKQVRKTVKFIYATRDDIFCSKNNTETSYKNEDHKNRTKFFDFIIPTVPIVSAANSYETMWSKIKVHYLKNKFSDSDIKKIEKNVKDCIKDFSTHLTDMRVIKNISNEYIIYSEKLVSVISNKKSLENEESIREEEVNLSLFYLEEHKLLAYIIYKNLFPKDFSDLTHDRGMIYKSLQKRGEAVEILSDMLESDKGYLENIIEDLKEKLVNSVDKSTIKQLKKEIEDQGGVLEGVNMKLNNLPLLKYMDLINADTHKAIFGKEMVEYPLLIDLVEKGYIDEDYGDYISYFIEGEMSRNDIAFIRNLNSNIPLGYRHGLNNFVEIISRLRLRDYKKITLLNFDFVDYLLLNYENDQNKIILDSMFSEFERKDAARMNFFNEYINRNRNIHNFINKICANWKCIWNYIIKQEDIDQDKMLLVLLENLELKNLGSINYDKAFTSYLCKMSHFLKVAAKSKDLDKVKKHLKEFEIKFEVLDKPTSDIEKQILTYIFNEGLFDINSTMISLYLDMFSLKEAELRFDMILDRVLKSNISGCVDYITKNISTFITNVLLKQETVIIEEKTVIDYIYKSNIDVSLKKAIVKKQNVSISNIESDYKELWDCLFKNSKVSPKWNNVIKYYSENGVTKIAVDFLNREQIYNELSKYSLPVKYKELFVEIIYSNISKASFAKLVMSFSEHRIDSLQSIIFSKVDSCRISCLISERIIQFNIANLNFFKKNDDYNFIELIVCNAKLFRDIKESYSLNPQHLRKIIDSRMNHLYIKDISNYYLSNSMRSNSSIEIIFKDPIKDSLLDFLILTSKSTLSLPNKIYILIEQAKYLEKFQVDKYLKGLGKPYSEASGYGGYCFIPYSPINLKLFKVLEGNSISSCSMYEGKIRVNLKRK